MMGVHGTNQRIQCKCILDRLQGILIRASLETENGAEEFMQNPPPKILTRAFAFCFKQKDGNQPKVEAVGGIKAAVPALCRRTRYER